MPSTRHVSGEKPSPELITTQHGIEFPTDAHLLVTAPGQISAWDATGVHAVFRSSKDGIVATTEVQDGSGMLAVADRHVVVLHDTKRRQEKSWGLRGGTDEVRHLTYTTDGKELFLSTHLTADIQRYSTEQAKLLSPTRVSDSPSTAFAVSPTGHLIISASDRPPVVYLKNLIHNSKPILIESRASSAAVSVIKFHPERLNIFLLAFRDGNIAAYNATKLSKNHAGAFLNQESVHKAQISHLSKIHRSTSGAKKAAAITDAAFLPGYKSRAVTVGSDGRCRIIDFADGGMVLRTWHAKAPVSSVSVISLRGEREPRNRSGSARSSRTLDGPTSTNNLIAISRIDGEVHIYDSLGLLVKRQMIGEDGERIISVEWVRGPSPSPVAAHAVAASERDLTYLSFEENAAEKPVSTAAPESATLPEAPVASRERRETLFEHVGLPAALREPNQIGKPDDAAPRRFTAHPDETDDGTVRHNPKASSLEQIPLARGDYLDLFSPVKFSEVDGTAVKKQRVSSPPQSRPRISSRTFVKSPQITQEPEKDSIASPRNLALFPSTESDSDTERPSAKKSALVIKQRARASPLTKRVTIKPDSRRPSRRSSTFSLRPATANNNAKVLADLRKMGAGNHVPHQQRGVLAAFSVGKLSPCCRKSPKRDDALRMFRRPTDHIETEHDSDNALNAYADKHEKRHWQEDSNQDSSLGDDIWLTSSSDSDTVQSRRRRPQALNRPPARQTSRSRVGSKGTMSTIAPDAPTAYTSDQRRAGFDGSTEEEMLTADTHAASEDTFSPSSNDLRDLFPRSSSLSPRKHRRTNQISPSKKHLSLREISPNAAAGRQAQTPWERAKTARTGLGPEELPERRLDTKMDLTMRQNGPNLTNAAVQPHCAICSPTESRVTDLEREVTRLKGEVIALKAALRQNDVPLPFSLRYS